MLCDLHLTGHFQDTLNDVKAANELQPSYIEPIERGIACWEVKRQKISYMSR